MEGIIFKRAIITVAVTAIAGVGALSLISKDKDIGGTIMRTYSAGECAKGACWTCKDKVDLDSVSITVDDTQTRLDAVKLAAGCTGIIRKLVINTTSGDGVKVSTGAHDLLVDRGYIFCRGKVGVVHQDGIQVLGGDKITFRGLIVRCPFMHTPGAKLNHSAFFVNGNPAPHAIIFENGILGGAGTTVDIGSSDASGVRNSAICPSTTIGKPFYVPKQPSGKGSIATNVVNSNNSFPKDCTNILPDIINIK